jgi:His/Glu/Gln/Arg/opine family amino acid ABC transporter permease subunit
MWSELWAQAAPRLGEAIWITVSLTLIAATCGVLLASLLAVLARSSLAVRAFAESYSFALRGTPLLVQLFLIYYGSGQFAQELRGLGLWGWFRDAYFCAALALSLNTAAYTYELIKGAFATLPKGAVEAGHAIGLRRGRILWRIEAPYVIRTALPAYINEFIFLFQATSLVSLITLVDITGLATNIASRTFRFFEVYLAAAAIYLVFVFIIIRVFQMLERRVNRHQRSIIPDGGRTSELAGLR